MSNPLIIPILQVLQDHPEGMSEYQLLQRLRAEGLVLTQAEDDADLALYRQHFLTMNALYRLKQDLLSDGYALSISALKIVLSRLDSRPASALPTLSEDDALARYYLDERELEKMSGEGVRALLTQFWERFAADDRRQGALDRLCLLDGCEWVDVKQAYRKQAFRCHPDRGGCANEFAGVRAAYEVLRQLYEANQAGGENG